MSAYRFVRALMIVTLTGVCILACGQKGPLKQAESDPAEQRRDSELEVNESSE